MDEALRLLPERAQIEDTSLSGAGPSQMLSTY